MERSSCWTRPTTASQKRAFTAFNSCLVSLLCSRSLFVPQAVPGPGGTHSQMTRGRAEERLSPLPARQVSLHVTEVYSGRGRHPQMKACQTSNGALLTLSCDPASDMRADVPGGQECQPLTQSGIHLAFAAPPPQRGGTRSIYQQLSGLILSVLPMPGKHFAD